VTVTANSAAPTPQYPSLPQVLHTPGHTGDSICLWHPSSRTLLCADTVLGWGSTTVAHLADYMKSLDELLALEPQPLALLPGHGPPILPSHQQQGLTPHSHIQQYKDHRNARVSQVRHLSKIVTF
jgi:glyoxylase-like metal-dependent hydrolase (beta-lactamase superfamily II)